MSKSENIENIDDQAPQGGNAPPAIAEPGKRRHTATYATDKRTGGYLVRVAGPDADKFAGREVPVKTKRDVEHSEKLLKIKWAGVDEIEDSATRGQNVALYTFASKPRDIDTIAF
jgi:hypothetical protein